MKSNTPMSFLLSLVATMDIFLQAMNEVIEINFDNWSMWINESTNFVWLIVFVGCFMIIKKALSITGLREIGPYTKVTGVGRMQKHSALFLAGLFSICNLIVFMGFKETSPALSAPMWDQVVFQGVKEAVVFIGSFVIFFCILSIFFAFISESRLIDEKKQWIFFTNNGLSFFVVGIAIVLCWLPAYSTFYPGFMTTDSMYQIREAIGEIGLSNHHPVIHTLLVSAFISLGETISTRTLGIGLYSAFQMVVMAAAISFSIWYLAKIGVNRAIRVCVLAYFVLNPMNAMYSVTMWKDILFSVILLILTIMLVEMARDAKKFFSSIPKAILFVLVAFLFCTMRNNGLYAFVIFLPIFLAVYRVYWKQLGVILVALFVLLASYNGPVFSYLGVEPEGKTEALSVPLQQIARTVLYHKDQLDSLQLQKIAEIFPEEGFEQKYNPQLSDPIKNSFDYGTFSKDKPRYMELWAELLFEYPETYFNSFFENSYGYWHPNFVPVSRFWSTYVMERCEELGIRINNVEEFYYEINTAAEAEERVNKTQAASEKVDHYFRAIYAIPGVSMLSSIGFMMWVALITFAIFLIKGRPKLVLPLVLILGLFITTIASPVCGEYRYAYGWMLAVPILFCVSLVAERFPDIPRKNHRRKSNQ